MTNAKQSLDAAADLKGIRTTDDDINSLASQSCYVYMEVVKHYQKIEALPKPPGFGELFSQSFVRGCFGDIFGLARSYNDAQGREDRINDEIRSLIATSKRGDSIKLRLPRVAARYAGPLIANGQLILIDFNASWGPVGPDDWLTLAHKAGTDLHNCTVLVELHNRSGETVRNIHFIPRWSNRTPIFAKYSPSWKLLGEPVNRHTVPAVEAVIISLWADELSQESVRQAYAGAERDNDVARYCKNMRVLASYRPFAKGVLWDTTRGVHVELKGIPFVTHPRVTVQFRRNNLRLSLSLYWEFDRWDEGENKTLDTGDKLQRFTPGLHTRIIP